MVRLQRQVAASSIVYEQCKWRTWREPWYYSDVQRNEASLWLSKPLYRPLSEVAPRMLLATGI